MMNSLALGAAVALICFLAGLIGFAVQVALHRRNALDDARGAIGLVLGLLTLLLSLSLGTLIGSTYFFSTGQQAQLQNLMSNTLMLDQALRRYGEETRPQRVALKATLTGVYDAIWLHPVDASELTVAANMRMMEGLDRYLAGLRPTTDSQKAALADAKAKLAAFEQTRVLMLLQLSAPFSKALLVIVGIWAAGLFFGFGLVSRRNATTLVAMGLGAASVAAALFLIIELGEPFTGYFRISPAAVLETIAALAN